METSLLILAATALLAFGFTVVPVLPGTLFVPLGAAAYALAEGWEELPWWFWLGQAVLVAACLLIDNLIQLRMLARHGASKPALWGATIGVLSGPLVFAPLLGPLALLVGAPIGAAGGAVLGEMHHRRDNPGVSNVELRQLGLRSVLAFVVGTAIKLVLVSIQVTWLAIELL